MDFELITLHGIKYHGDIAEVSLMTTAGQVAILPRHEPLTTVVAPGAVVIRARDGKTELYAIFGGLLEITADGVRLLADEAEHAEDMVVSEIKTALTDAQELRSGAKDSRQVAHAHRLIDRHTVRLDVARLHRHKNIK